MSVPIPAATPYDWLKSIPSGLLDFNDIPLTGQSPPFPWQKFSDGLIKLFELDKLSLTPGSWNWLAPDALLSGVSGDPHIIHLGFSGYEGKAFLAIDKRDLDAVICLMLAHRPLELSPFDPSHKTAFLHFLVIAFCDQFASANWEKGLQIFQLPGDDLLPEENLLSLDVQVEFSQRSFPVRLFIDNVLREAWKQKHLPTFNLALNPTLAKKVEIPVSIEAGVIHMKQKAWNNLRLGDLLLLDSFTLDKTFNSGSVLLRIHHLPYYKARLSEGNVILEEQPSYHEIESAMARNPTNDDSDFDFDDDTKTEHTEEESSFDLDSDFDFTEESDFLTEAQEETKEEADVPHKEEGASAPPPPPVQKTAASAQTPTASTAQPAGKEVSGVAKQTPAPSASPKDIPLQIAVEVGRFQMTIEKMMELQPGNTLNLYVRPEDGVDLVVNGRRIGRGELLRFGDTLGIRILEIG